MGTYVETITMKIVMGYIKSLWATYKKQNITGINSTIYVQYDIMIIG